MVQGAREGWPRFVWLLVVVGLVRGSVAKVHHSRRAGSSGTNEMMICRLMMVVLCGSSDNWLVRLWCSDLGPCDRLSWNPSKDLKLGESCSLFPRRPQARLPSSHAYPASVWSAVPARACRGGGGEVDRGSTSGSSSG